MAPRRGGRIRIGYGSSSTCDNPYPCSDALSHMYGSFEPYQAPSELYGQLVLYAIWGAAFLVMLGIRRPESLPMRLWSVLVAVFWFLVACMFLCVRFGCIAKERGVLVGYRYEASVVTLMWRLGMIFLFGGMKVTGLSKIWRIAFYAGLGIYAALNITYSVMDFIISSHALEHWKKTYEDGGLSIYQDLYAGIPQWWLSDRDFALTFTSAQIIRLLRTESIDMEPMYIKSRMYDESSIGSRFLDERGLQIRIGTAADCLALALALFLLFVALRTYVGKRKARKAIEKEDHLVLAASTGLFVTTLLRAVVATHYILGNWRALEDPGQWQDWINGYDLSGPPGEAQSVDGRFLSGYRTTASGFPIIQALFEPLGIVMACLAMVMWWRMVEL